jgi:hypothetical protein
MEVATGGGSRVDFGGNWVGMVRVSGTSARYQSVWEWHLHTQRVPDNGELASSQTNVSEAAFSKN